MTDPDLKQKVAPKTNIEADKSPVPNIAVSTSFSKQKYLYAYVSPAEIQHFFRTQAHEDENKRLPEVLKKWHSIQSKVNMTRQKEAGQADSITIQIIPPEHEAQVSKIVNDPNFQKTFSNFETYTSVVEIDKLIVKQNTINVDYAKKLKNSYPEKPTFKELIDICLSPSRDMEPIQHLELPAPNPVHVFSSLSSDLRFLGSTIKTLTPDDLKYSPGGLPGAAIITFIGYGVASINAYQVGSRIILNNGTHRVYTLRSLGVTHIPIVIQKIDPSSPLLNQVLGGAAQYLCANPRPIFMKDFFDDDFTLTVNMPRYIQTVTVIVNQDTHSVPT